MEKVIELLRKMKGENILDVATGRGEFVALIKDQLPNSDLSKIRQKPELESQII